MVVSKSSITVFFSQFSYILHLILLIEFVPAEKHSDANEDHRLDLTLNMFPFASVDL